MNDRKMVKMEQMAKAVEELIKESGIKVNISFKRVWKNNIELNALFIAQEGRRITPTVYFNEQETKEQLADRVKNALEMEVPEVDISNIFTKKYFNEHLRPRLIADNEVNRKGLEESGITYIPYEALGLLITFEVTLDGFKDGGASIQLNREHIEKVGMSKEDVFDRAKKNIGEEMEVLSMRDMLLRTMNLPEEKTEDILPMDDIMYVLTTHDRRYGAACLLSENSIGLITKTIGTSEFYILPSSVHEVIIIRKSDVVESDELLNMVISVNASEVEPEERLADAVFAVVDGRYQKVA